MSDLSAIIGANLAEIRKTRGLSLDKVAELSGVSKAMIGQIERGESNPTVATLWKIALGLRVSFSEFITEKRRAVELVRYADLPPVADEAGGMKVYLLFPYRPTQPFEAFIVTLASGCCHSSDAHEPGAEEYILLMAGTLEVAIGPTTYLLKPGDAIRYRADQPHVYRNAGVDEVRFQNIVCYAAASGPQP